MGNLLLASYIADLKTGTTEKKISAAHELGNMGSAAKSAISALESLSGDVDLRQKPLGGNGRQATWRARC